MRGIEYTITPQSAGRLAYAARIGDIQPQSTQSFGCLSWPACVAGGTLCPDPQGFGASLNPCCHFQPPPGPCPDSVPARANSDGSFGAVGAAEDAASSAAQSIVTGGIPSWAVGAGIGLAVFLALKGLGR